MKRLILLFFILLISVWAGLKISHNPGTVALTTKMWIIEVPLWFFIIIELILFAVCYLLLRLFGFLGHSFQNTQRWLSHIKHQRAQNLTDRGAVELIEGKWKKAEKHLIKAARSTGSPFLNYLGAAFASHQQKNYGERDNYLNKAQRSAPNETCGVEITKAHFEMESHEWINATKTLKEVLIKNPKNKLALKLLQESYTQLEDWQSLKELLPTLKSTNTLDPEEISHLELTAYHHLLDGSAKQHDPQLLQQAWQQIPKALKTSVALNVSYIQQLMELNQHDEAEMQCREILKRQWSDELVSLYGEIKASEEKQQLMILEDFLTQHPQNPTLLLALGRVCIRNQLWGKAQTYLKRSLELSANPVIYTELAKLPKQLS